MPEEEGTNGLPVLGVWSRLRTQTLVPLQGFGVSSRLEKCSGPASSVSATKPGMPESAIPKIMTPVLA